MHVCFSSPSPASAGPAESQSRRAACCHAPHRSHFLNENRPLFRCTVCAPPRLTGSSPSAYYAGARRGAAASPKRRMSAPLPIGWETALAPNGRYRTPPAPCGETPLLSPMAVPFAACPRCCAWWAPPPPRCLALHRRFASAVHWQAVLLQPQHGAAHVDQAGREVGRGVELRRRARGGRQVPPPQAQPHKRRARAEAHAHPRVAVHRCARGQAGVLRSGRRPVARGATRSSRRILVSAHCPPSAPCDRSRP